MAYDFKCYDLAEHFLPIVASERLKMMFAQHIQDTVDDWLETQSVRIKAGLIPAAASGTLIVHLLHAGLPMCGFSRRPPVDWPDGHKWEGADRLIDVNCPECRAAIAASQSHSDVIHRVLP